MPLKPLVVSILLLCSLTGVVHAQDGVKKRIPIAVSHLSPANRVIIRSKNAPRHHIFRRILCFQINCRRAGGWQRSQKQKRFNGYKDVPQVKDAKKGKQPEQKVLIHTTEPPAPAPDTVKIRKEIAPIVQKPAVTERKFVLSDVLFDYNSPALKQDFTSQLDTLVDILTRKPATLVTIIGHTDNTGRESYNQRLSTSRAESVGLYLISKGIASDRISFEGRGSTQPIADNTFEEGRRKNRRVEIILKE